MTGLQRAIVWGIVIGLVLGLGPIVLKAFVYAGLGW